jgi:hypothetical protein
MCAKHGSYSVSMENWCKWPLNIDFDISGSSFRGGKKVSYFLILNNGDHNIVIQLSGRFFIYQDDVVGDESVRINEARLYFKLNPRIPFH